MNCHRKCTSRDLHSLDLSNFLFLFLKFSSLLSQKNCLFVLRLHSKRLLSHFAVYRMESCSRYHVPKTELRHFSTNGIRETNPFFEWHRITIKPNFHVRAVHIVTISHGDNLRFLVHGLLCHKFRLSRCIKANQSSKKFIWHDSVI